MKKTHDLKTWPSFYEALLTGEKTFEIRLNDRDFAVGDVLILHEFQPGKGPTDGAGYTGRKMLRLVSYVMPGGRFGIDPHYCVLALQDTK